MTQQGLRQLSFRNLVRQLDPGYAGGTHNEDMMAGTQAELVAAEKSVPGTINGRLLAWVRHRLGDDTVDLNGGLAAFAQLYGAHDWASLGAFEMMFDLSPFSIQPSYGDTTVWRTGVFRDAAGSVVRSQWRLLTDQISVDVDTGGTAGTPSLLGALHEHVNVGDFFHANVNTLGTLQTGMYVVKAVESFAAGIVKGVIELGASTVEGDGSDTVTITPDGGDPVVFAWGSGGDYTVPHVGSVDTDGAALATSINAAITAEDLPAEWVAAYDSGTNFLIITSTNGPTGTIEHTLAIAEVGVVTNIDVSGRVDLSNIADFSALNSD